MINFSFFNPKAGVTYALTDASSLYVSYAIAHRNRTAPTISMAMINLNPSGSAIWSPVGRSKAKLRDASQLLPYELSQSTGSNGKLNDVGSPIRANVGRSYRTGLELSGMVKLSKHVTLNANATWSVNRNQDYAYRIRETPVVGNTSNHFVTIMDCGKPI